jgi:acyl dehydratase
MDAKPFPTIRRRITAEMVALYGHVNNDRNMIHYDDAAARAAGFPRAVVHGAITAAVLSEACHAHFGPGWLTSGRLAVKFVKPLFVGDTVSTHGRPRDTRSGAWELWCENGAGEIILAGEAELLRSA